MAFCTKNYSCYCKYVYLIHNIYTPWQYNITCNFACYKKIKSLKRLNEVSAFLELICTIHREYKLS